MTQIEKDGFNKVNPKTFKQKEITTIDKIQDKVFEIYQKDKAIKHLKHKTDQIESTINSIRKQIAEASKQYGESLKQLEEKVPMNKKMLEELWDQRHQLNNDLEDLEYDFEQGN